PRGGMAPITRAAGPLWSGRSDLIALALGEDGRRPGEAWRWDLAGHQCPAAGAALPPPGFVDTGPQVGDQPGVLGVEPAALLAAVGEAPLRLRQPGQRAAGPHLDHHLARRDLRLQPA